MLKCQTSIDNIADSVRDSLKNLGIDNKSSRSVAAAIFGVRRNGKLINVKNSLL